MASSPWSDRYLPIEQVVQEEEAVEDAYRPAEQMMQSVSASWFAAIAEESLLNLPATHDMQEVLPEVAAYCPAGQTEQVADAEMEDNVPRAQDTQSAEESWSA